MSSETKTQIVTSQSPVDQPLTQTPAVAQTSAVAQALVTAQTPAVAQTPESTEQMLLLADQQSSKKTRRVITPESTAVNFDELIKMIESQIESLRIKAATPLPTGSKPSTSTGIKFLKSVGAAVKAIKKDSLKLFESSKKKPRTGPKKTDGGFLTKHKFTPAMAEFAGWSADDTKSRVDITNSIIDYVKKQNLQDSTFRKNIIPDQKLKNLLQYDPSLPGKEPLTFFYLQKLIGQLQIKDQVAKK
jgi:chromatin remodeling complex protein RSC6